MYQKILIKILALIGKVPLCYLLLVEPLAIKFIPNIKTKINYEGLLIDVDFSEPTQRKIALGTFEKTEHRYLKKFIRPGDNVIDIGANFGYISLRLSNLMKFKGTLNCYEPIKSNCVIFSQTILKTDKPEFFNLHNLAVSSDGRRLTLGKPSKHNGAFTAAASGFYTITNTENSVIVDSLGINDLLDEHELIDFIKIDVEGMESEILTEISKNNLCKIKCIMFEVTVGTQGFSEEQSKIFTFFNKNNFIVRKPLFIGSFQISKGLEPNILSAIIRYPLITWGALTKKSSDTVINFFAFNKDLALENNKLVY